MMKNKILAAVAAAALACALLPSAALAHGGHGGRVCSNYAPCTVENCSIAHAHEHDGTYYAGHNYTDGYAACTVPGCTRTAIHRHGGRGRRR